MKKDTSRREPRIKVSKDGPYLVSGSPPLSKEIIVCDQDNEPLEWKEGANTPAKRTYALCRCGGSANKPFCDGTHNKNGFDGTETADRKKYSEQAKAIKQARNSPSKTHDPSAQQAASATEKEAHGASQKDQTTRNAKRPQ